MKVDRLFGVFNIEIGKDYQDNLRLSFFGKQSLKKRKVKIMLVLGMVFAVLVAVAAEVSAIKNDLAQAQQEGFLRGNHANGTVVMGFEKMVRLGCESLRLVRVLGVKVPVFKV